MARPHLASLMPFGALAASASFPARMPFGIPGSLMPPPPSGFGYVFRADGQGRNQVVTFTDASGVTRPYLARLSS